MTPNTRLARRKPDASRLPLYGTLPETGKAVADTGFAFAPLPTPEGGDPS